MKKSLIDDQERAARGEPYTWYIIDMNLGTNQTLPVIATAKSMVEAYKFMDGKGCLVLASQEEYDRWIAAGKPKDIFTYVKT